MKYKTKSIILGRKKSKDVYDLKKPCFIALFNVNNPHQKNEVPEKILEFDKIHKVVISKLSINYLLPGNDLIINNLEFIEVETEGPHVFLSGKQKSR